MIMQNVTVFYGFVFLNLGRFKLFTEIPSAVLCITCSLKVKLSRSFFLFYFNNIKTET